MSVPDIVDRCKEWGREALKGDTALFIIFIVMMTISFALGFMAGGEGKGAQNESGGVVITEGKLNTASASISVDSLATGPIVASRTGSKYHLLSCSGAKTIKEENKVYFNTSAEAESAGYTKASNCKGL